MHLSDIVDCNLHTMVSWELSAQLCQEYSYQKLSESDNLSSSQ